MKKKKSNIIKYRRPFRPNMAVIIFIILGLYMAFTVYSYLSRNKVTYYEVTEGGIVKSNTYTGIILREEKEYTAPNSGYINFYVREGKRVSVGARVYSLDETGSLKSFLEDNPEMTNTLSQDNIYELKKMLSSYSMTYKDVNFIKLYDNKYSLDSKLLEYSGTNAMTNLDELLVANGITYARILSEDTGVVSYEIDGYENDTISDINKSDLNNPDYSIRYVKSGDLVEAGSTVYKLVTSELWSLVFELPDDKKAEYADKKQLTIKIDGSSKRLTGSYSQQPGKDGTYFGVLEFDKYMVDYLDSRYLKFEIDDGEENGLKIPKSAITEKTFFTIPEDYLTRGGDDIDEGFYKEVYDQKGTSIVYTPVTIYYQKDGMYYIDTSDSSEIKAGDYIIKPDSTDRYQVGSTAVLKGVYNINKGYAVFKQIDIIATNDEYYTVKKNMKYGLAEYDHIMLDASDVTEGEFIYK